MKDCKKILCCIFTIIIALSNMNGTLFTATEQEAAFAAEKATLVTSASEKVITLPAGPSASIDIEFNLLWEVHDNPEVEKIILSKGVKSILNDMFYETDPWLVQNYASLTPNCPNLKEVEVDPENPYFIVVDGVLYNKEMTQLYYCPPGKEGELTIPEGVKIIGHMAFQDCSKLTAIYLPSTVEVIMEGAFGGNSRLASLVVNDENPYYKSLDHVIYTQDGEELVAYAAGKAKTYYSIRYGTKIIRPAAFMGSAYLEKVTIPYYLSTVGNEAFRNCRRLKTVNILPGLRDIHAGAFMDCSNLSKINLPNGIRSLSKDVFTGCNQLLEIKFPSSLQRFDSSYGKVANRVLRFYSPYHGKDDTYFNVIAKGVKVYAYRDSYLASNLLANGSKVIYFEDEYATISGSTKAPKSAVTGKGVPDTSWYVKSKKEYKLSNPDQLAGLAVLVKKGVSFQGKKIELVRDLDLGCYPNWEPIGSIDEDYSYRYFKGSFDGNSHVIYNLRIHRTKLFQGLFGLVQGNIQNLTIADGEIYASSLSGILVGEIIGTIKNCKVSGTITGQDKVGGISGLNTKDIQSCSVDVKVNGIYAVGGITGDNRGRIIDCNNQGSIFGWDSVGGFAGNSGGEAIQNCSNRMVVEGDINVGGILGYLSWDTKVTNCSNEASVKGNESVGGVVGCMGFSGLIKECMNKAPVSGIYQVGGISGYMSVATMEDCRNEADVQGISTVGGVLGRLGYSTPEKQHIYNCESTNNARGSRYVNELVGRYDYRR